MYPFLRIQAAVLLSLVAGSAAFPLPFVAVLSAPPSVTALNITQYIGRWCVAPGTCHYTAHYTTHLVRDRDRVTSILTQRTPGPQHAVLHLADMDCVCCQTQLRSAGSYDRYQVYGSASVQDTFEVGGSCVTADYGTTARADVVMTPLCLEQARKRGRGEHANCRTTLSFPAPAFPCCVDSCARCPLQIPSAFSVFPSP
jgi:hypothetical protein